MSRYTSSLSYYNKYRKPALPFRGESIGAKMHEYNNFPYTYAYDVPGVVPYHRPNDLYSRSMQRPFYGRAVQSEYGYRSPFAHQSDLFGYRQPYNFAESEINYYRDYYHHPRYSKYYDYWY